MESFLVNMEISPILLTWLLIYSFIFGAVLGVIDDVTIVFCKRVKGAARICRFVFDFALCAVATVGIILLNYYLNKGIFRAFTLVGAVAGMWVYKNTLSAIVRILLGYMLELLERILRVIAAPILKLLFKLVSILLKVKYFIQKTLEKIRGMVYNNYIKGKVFSKAEKGFLADFRER